MMRQSFEIIRNEGRLLYEYVRGSHLYGLNTESSDRDTSGVFICKPDHALGFLGYEPQVSDERHDNTWYEAGELLRLLCKSNPTVLEALFVPEDMILGDVHPLMRMIIDSRDQFVSRMCFKTFYGYAESQIVKARGLNKKIVNPVTERLSPFEFIYTFVGQGSTRFRDWLRNRGVFQEYCGLVNVPNMHDTYGVYYDFGAHVAGRDGWKDDTEFLAFSSAFFGMEAEAVKDLLSGMKTKGYRGVIAEDESSNEVRLSSVEDRNERPICFIQYNQSGYTTHCRQYREYIEWEQERNPVRFESNLGHNYDSKNMMHCFRLIHMAKEVARGEGLILRRTWDHDFLMDVRNHRFEYEDLIGRLEEEKNEMAVLMKESTIRESVDQDFVNRLLIDIRKEQLGMYR